MTELRKALTDALASEQNQEIIEEQSAKEWAQCPNCGDGMGCEIEECENIRPNGEKMKLFECHCGQIWKE